MKKAIPREKDTHSRASVNSLSGQRYQTGLLDDLQQVQSTGNIAHIRHNRLSAALLDHKIDADDLVLSREHATACPAKTRRYNPAAHTG